jgi:signal transduction histidine kinase
MARRRLTLVVQALLVILLSLVAYILIAASPMTLRGLSNITLIYPAYVKLTNCILAVICGSFLMWPKESGQLVGNWNRYVGVAFFTFSVQYGLRFLAAILGPQFHDYVNYIDTTAIVTAYLGSYFNNILFLAAARILLNKNRRVPRAPETTKSKGVWPLLRREWTRLQAALPEWYPAMFLLTLLALLEEVERFLPAGRIQEWLGTGGPYLWFMRGLLFVRIPDAVFSVYCLAWFAYAIWLNFYVRRRRPLAWLGFVLVLVYAAGQIVYAANPFIARSIGDPEMRWFPATAVRSYLKDKVSDNITAKVAEDNRKAAASAASGKSQPYEPKSFTEGAKEYFDNAIFAILFPMKSLLFLPAFVLYLLLLSSVNGFRQVHRELTNKRKDYLSKDGILDVIGSSLEAEVLELIVLLPGTHRRMAREERVVSEVWLAPGVRPIQERPRVSSLDAIPLLRQVMKEDGTEIIVNDRDGDAVATGLRERDPLPQTLVIIPIKFHGGVIGVLRVLFRGYGKYYDGTSEQLKFMAELIAPSVQDFRTMSAVDKLGPRLSRAQAGALRQGNVAAGNFQRAIERMVETLYDLLSPLSIGLRLNCGFTPVRRAHPKRKADRHILKDPRVGYYDPPGQAVEIEEQSDGAAPKGRRSGAERFVIVQTERGLVRVERDYLEVRKDEGGRFNLGTIFLAICNDNDEFSHPTLAAYYLTRLAIASQTAHAIFNAARNALGLIVQDLGVRLNKETLSPAEWFTEVEAAASQSGLLWVVVSEGEGLPKRGTPEHVSIVEKLVDENREAMLTDPLGRVANPDPESLTRHVIHLLLKGDGQHLWLGVRREEFGKELEFDSPWKAFLLNVATVAGTALVRIEERRQAEVERKKEEARRLREADDEWLKTFADLNATVMHQLTNMVHNMLGITRKLELAGGGAANGKLPAAIGDIKSYADLMLKVANAYNQLIRGDGLGSCDIAAAARLAEQLFHFGLRKKMIETRVIVKPGAIVKVPAYVVALALASLIGNAVDAIQSRGSITITAKPEGEDVLCLVANDGPPIDEELRPRLFERGLKGKQGHSGCGLYLVRRSLQNYDGEVALSHSNSEETCFILRLPRSHNASLHD